MRLSLVLIVIGILALGGYWYWTTTPQYAVSQIKAAVKGHDLKKFQKYVDLDTTSNRMVDDFLTKPMQKAMGGGLIGRVIITGVVSFLKPKMAEGIKQELVNYVETGNFKQDDAGDDAGVNGVSLSSADEHFGFRKHAYKGIASTQVEGGLAQMSLIFYNARYNQDLTLDVKLRKMDNYWQAVELSNFPQFCSKLAQLEVEGQGGAQDQTADPQTNTGI